MPQKEPKPGEKYLHFKHKLYQIITVARHSETGEPMVVYQALYGDFGIYVRPYDMFISEVDHEKYPEVKQKYRFQLLENVDETPDICGKDVSASGEKEIPSDVSEGVNPWLIRFLDAETFAEKYELLTYIKEDLTDKLIDDLAVSVDVVIPEGNLKDRYMQLKNCIRTRQKFERR